MTGYEHDLGRSETNLDVFYPILNLFFALEVQNHPNPKTDIANRFPSTRILRALIDLFKKVYPPKKWPFLGGYSTKSS